MTKRMISALFVAVVGTVLAITPATNAQQPTKPLTNGDVIKMTKSGLAESTILAVIRANRSNFDASPDALIALKSAGVSQNVISEVVTTASSNDQKSITPAASAPATPAGPGAQVGPPPNAEPSVPGKVSTDPATSLPSSQTLPSESSAQSKEPSVILLPAGSQAGTKAPPSSIALPLEKTQLSQTKTKSSSLGHLANDSATTQALESGVNTAAWEGAVHSGSLPGEVAANQTGSILSSVMSHRKSAVTYLWAVTGPNSPVHAPSNQPSFVVNFAGWMYVSVDEFEPVIVKLTPTPPPTVWRLVGASQGKENEFSSSAVDWQGFSNFLQDQAPTRIKKVSPGLFEISAQAPLEAGEYGIVLRPLSKTMKFSGADIARNQGNGKIFNSVWTFDVK
jgi:hypothetical protein